MKYSLIFLLPVLIGGNLYAQDVTYWVGRSTHPDPIMRHHEAFMEAFVQYIKFAHYEGDSCRVETISSITNDGKEVLTIAIGNGILVKYNSLSETLEYENETHNTIVLKIEYEKDREKSIHTYQRTNIVDINTNQNIKSNFAYCCNYDYVQK